MRHLSISVLLLIGLTGPLVAVAAETVTPTQCGPGDAGSPCGGDGPASLGNNSDTDQGAGLNSMWQKLLLSARLISGGRIQTGNQFTT